MFPPNYTPAPACVPCLNEIVACLVGYLPIPKLGCVWYELFKENSILFKTRHKKGDLLVLVVLLMVFRCLELLLPRWVA